MGHGHELHRPVQNSFLFLCLPVVLKILQMQLSTSVKVEFHEMEWNSMKRFIVELTKNSKLSSGSVPRAISLDSIPFPIPFHSISKKKLLISLLVSISPFHFLSVSVPFHQIIFPLRLSIYFPFHYHSISIPFPFFFA